MSLDSVFYGLRELQTDRWWRLQRALPSWGAYPTHSLSRTSERTRDRQVIGVKVIWQEVVVRALQGWMNCKSNSAHNYSNISTLILTTQQKTLTKQYMNTSHTYTWVCKYKRTAVISTLSFFETNSMTGDHMCTCWVSHAPELIVEPYDYLLTTDMFSGLWNLWSTVWILSTIVPLKARVYFGTTL